LDPFHQRIEDIISRDLQLLPDRHFELDQRILELTPAAEQLMLQFVNANLNRGVADLQYYTGYANRLTEHMLRIAGTLAVFDLKAVIDEAAILAATDLMDYFTEQRLNLEVGVTSRNADLVSAAEKLLHWMQQKSFTGTKREIRNYVRWFKALTGEEADRILEELVIDGSLVMEEITPNKGRQYVVYRVADTVLTESIDSIE
jgi:DNA-directed RNA polymerase subunit F